MILVGHHATSGYKLFGPIEKQVKISRDVIVDEMKNWSVESDLRKNSELVFELDSNIRSYIEWLGGEKIIHDVISDSQINETIYQIYLALFAEAEPVTLDEALKNEKWTEAMKE
jgi:hypothetical protein